MSDRDVVIRVENISKLYRLGEVGTGSLAHDVNRWWHKVRGKENPYLKIGEVNDRTKPAARAVASNESRVTGEEGPGAVASYWSRVKTNPPLDPPPATSYPLQRRQAHPPPVTRHSAEGACHQSPATASETPPPPATAPTGASAPATSYSPPVTALRNVASLLEVGMGFHPELTGRARSAQNSRPLPPQPSTLDARPSPWTSSWRWPPARRVFRLGEAMRSSKNAFAKVDNRKPRLIV